LPDDVLWLVIKEVILANSKCKGGYAVIYQYHDGVHGYSKDGTLGRIVLSLGKTHPKFRRCIRKRCIWHVTGNTDGWDFCVGSFNCNHVGKIWAK
jgi:hypothetical protein